jgi:hypothetical protein
LGGAASCALPRTFTVFGQKFVPDSWALSQAVFSSILWTENEVTNIVQRRVPGALDMAFSVLGNDQVVSELIAQMKGTFEESKAWRRQCGHAATLSLAVKASLALLLSNAER